MEEKMKCPQCQVPLVITDRQHIEIDFCPECRGVWLDRGELDKILERSQRHEPNRKYDVWPNDYVERKPFKKKRESIFEELFDF